MSPLANPAQSQLPLDVLVPEVSSRAMNGVRPVAFRSEGDEAGRASWRAIGREYFEVCCAIGAVTAAGWLIPLTYHTYGLIYLLAVIVLSLRVGRWPVLVAAVLSAATWIFVFIPPRLSFDVLESDDGLLLGTYLVVALVAGQLTARLRAKERHEHARERRATALFHLTRAIAEAQTFDEAVAAVKY